MTIRGPFRPHMGSTQVVNAAAASATITIGKGDKSINVINTDINEAYFRTGLASDGTVTASAADMPIRAGQERTIEVPQDHDTVAYYSLAGARLIFTSGEGGV